MKLDERTIRRLKELERHRAPKIMLDLTEPELEFLVEKVGNLPDENEPGGDTLFFKARIALHIARQPGGSFDGPA